MLEGAKPEGTSDVAYSQNQPPVVLSETSNPKRIAEVGEEPSDLGGGSDWGTGDRDAGAKRERALRRFEDAVARQAIQRIPVHGIRRAVLLPYHDDRVRVLVLDALDAPLNRDAALERSRRCEAKEPRTAGLPLTGWPGGWLRH